MRYEPMLHSIQNYADTAIQYGFTLLFITALPCASFFSLLNNYVKVKFNAWKLVNVSKFSSSLKYGVLIASFCLFLFQFYQRPIPNGAQDIGTWQSIFTIISIASVITNAGLIVFTMDVLWDYSLFGRTWYVSYFTRCAFLSFLSCFLTLGSLLASNGFSFFANSSPNSLFLMFLKK